jgi:hypothetical protein
MKMKTDKNQNTISDNNTLPSFVNFKSPAPDTNLVTMSDEMKREQKAWRNRRKNTRIEQKGKEKKKQQK